MGGPAHVLVVDDDLAVGQVLAALLRQAGHLAEHVASATAALARLDGGPPDLIVSDLRMPGMDGLGLLDEVRRRAPGLPVILITAHGTIPLAVEAMRSGAADFILKPFDREGVLFSVAKALATVAESPPPPPASGIVGRSEAIQKVLARLDKVAAGTATVLVRGESGTGKELVARAIHDRSPRAKGPFVAVQLGALPEALLESELFGYEKGAFTGAAARKPGRIELADGGTLFLDEIGDVPLPVQVKLLRVLQERQLARLGSVRPLKVDVRVVSATHRDLEAMVAAGQFREDLLYRLNVVPIVLPPLRERGDDIAPLARHFLALFMRENARPGLSITPEAVTLLGAQPWPGNVRELANVIERLVVLCDGPVIDVSDVERELHTAPAVAPVQASLDARRLSAERAALKEALERCAGNRTQAARILGVSRRTLYYKLNEHGLA
jgi:DNA-binding NtrC family response regulator